ncbi:TPA: hypothetical protein N0F65_008130 [Lagenidium giganteum]|uniref:Uncharacterized protein n=1 Tax=Lagenidium giganteum TaxID=4803 RepID=A0AAV2Z1J2_9STRA|nr:TPA: hypothetical protein N0F65_008130 [Lagenidium giganteum]
MWSKIGLPISSTAVHLSTQAFAHPVEEGRFEGNPECTWCTQRTRGCRARR